MLDNNKYNLFISKYIIYIKKCISNKNICFYIYSYDTSHNKNIENILKDTYNYNVLINFKNNILKISINDNILINYNFNNTKEKHYKLNNIVLHDIGKYNNFIDILHK